jgi:hypothetical protein
MVLAVVSTYRRHVSEGASVILVDKKTRRTADPVLVDLRSGKVLDERDFVFAAGPAASERTRLRYSSMEKRFTPQWRWYFPSSC